MSNQNSDQSNPFVNALQVFHESAQKVPAYQRLLKESGVDPESVKSIVEFNRLPITSKTSYILRNQLPDLCLCPLDRMCTFSASSGATGQVTFWPVLTEQEQEYSIVTERMLRDLWRIDTISTALIVSLMMGIWVGGGTFSRAGIELSRKKSYPLTVVTPGLVLSDTLRVIRDISPLYSQSIMVIFREFLLEVLEQGPSYGIDFEKLNIQIFTGGENISEDWKKYVCKKLGASINDLTRVISVYAAADAGYIIGIETPLTVTIRRLALENHKLAMDLFGKTNLSPSIVQFDPMKYYIESVEDKLLITSRAGLPLIRYDIKDSGGIVEFSKILHVLENHGYGYIIDEIKKYGEPWSLPMVYIFGRTDKAIIIDACEIWEENAEAVLYDRAEVRSYLFQESVGSDQRKSFLINVELEKSFLPTDDLIKELAEVFLRHIREKNPDFADAVSQNPRIAPRVELYLSGEGPFEKEGQKIKKQRG